LLDFTFGGLLHWVFWVLRGLHFTQSGGHFTTILSHFFNKFYATIGLTAQKVCEKISSLKMKCSQGTEENRVGIQIGVQNGRNKLVRFKGKV